MGSSFSPLLFENLILFYNSDGFANEVVKSGFQKLSLDYSKNAYHIIFLEVGKGNLGFNAILKWI